MSNPNLPKYQKEHMVTAIEHYINVNKAGLTVHQLQRWVNTLNTVQAMITD